jgi:hypothetical protein
MLVLLHRYPVYSLLITAPYGQIFLLMEKKQYHRHQKILFYLLYLCGSTYAASNIMQSESGRI